MCQKRPILRWILLHLLRRLPKIGPVSPHGHVAVPCSHGQQQQEEPMREFTTVVTEIQERLGDDEWPLEFKLDGRVMHFRRPHGGEGVLLITAMAMHNDIMSKFSSTLDIVSRVLRPDDRDWLNSRMLDTRDPMHIQAPTIMAGGEGEGGVVQEIVRQWGGRPTESPSPSSESPPDAGPGSSPFIQTPISPRSPYPGF
jgi:hypothetical protein